MANKTEQSNIDRWVDDRLANLQTPESHPDIESRLRQVEHKERARRQRRRAAGWTALSLAAAFVVVLSFPSARTRAQFVFRRIALKGIQIVGVRPDIYSAFIFEWTVRPTPAHMVTGPDAAAREAGYIPSLPDWTMVSQPVPSFGIGVMGAGAGRYLIRVSDLRAALKRAGATDVVVPDAWDNVQIEMDMSPTVYINARGFILIQSLPPHVTMPEGFALAAFIEALLRVGGIPAPQARAIAQRIESPGALLGLPADAQIETREIQMRSGTGVLIENATGRTPPAGCVLCPGPRDVELAWQTASRTYILKTDLNEARAVAVADSLP
jgi:hypothetical protein